MLATHYEPLGKVSIFIKTPAKRKKTIAMGGAMAWPISTSGAKAAIVIPRKTAAIHSIIKTKIKVKNRYGSGFSYTI